MSEFPKAIKIKELPETTFINDADIFIIEDGSVTHKITGKNLISYIKSHEDINNYYIPQSSIDVSNGVTPLNENRKVPSDNINFGTTTGTVFDGGRGKALEDGLDAHLLDNDPHGAKAYTDTKIDSIIGEGASETLDTIGELAKAIEEHQDVTDALNSAIGNKANTSDLTSHINDTTKHHTHDNKSVLDSITQAKVNTWDSVASGGTGISSLTDLGVNASATELNYVKGVTSNIQTQLDNKASSSHGNHVPTTQTANNAVFLRNDNTWQTVTPTNIGAASSSHTHSSYYDNTTSRDANTVLAAPNGSAGTASFRKIVVGDLPTGTSSSTVSLGNHTHNYAGSSSAGGAATSALTATKATQDSNGNNIVDTYATKASLGTQVTYTLDGTTLYISTK